MERHQAEVIVQGLLDGHNLTDLFPPVGSPAYVRSLRDQAVMRILSVMPDEARKQAADVAANNEGDFQSTMNAMLALWATELADAGLYALGYQPPGEPGKEGKG